MSDKRRIENCEIIPLCVNSRVLVYNPKIEFFYDRIRSSNYFSFPRQQHAIWDYISAVSKIGEVCPKNFKSIAEKMEALVERKRAVTNKSLWSINKHLVEELLWFMHSKKPPGLFYAVSDVGFSPTGEFPSYGFGHRRGSQRRQAVIKKMLPPDEIPFHGAVWKAWACSGKLRKFIKDHRDRKIVVVGPPYFKDFGERANLKDYEFVEIDYWRALEKYKEIYEAVLQKKHDDALYFLVGGFLANWLAFKLHGEFKRSFIIDIGRALDSYYVDLATQMRWSWLKKGWVP